MKVLMISKALIVGAYHGKLRELTRLGAKLSLVIPHRWGEQLAECTYSPDYEIIRMRCFLSGKNHLHFYPQLAKVFKDVNYDIVHIDEEPFSLITYQCMRLCARNKKPAIFFTWQNVHKKYPPPFGFIEKHNFTYVLGAIAGNTEALAVLRRRGFAKPVWVIPQFGIDPKVFQREDASELRTRLQLQDSFAVAYVGRVVEEKGLDTAVEALAQMSRDCVLVIVGSGPFRSVLEKQAERLGVAKRIRWISAIRSTDVPEYMNAFDALILPSKTRKNWKEQFGRVLVEAMACGTPAVASSSGEIPRVLADAGLVFPEGDAAALAESLRLLMTDSELRSHLSSRGRERVLKYFTHEKVARDTFEVYRSVLSETKCA